MLPMERCRYVHQTTLEGDYIPVGSDRASADDSRHKRELMDCRKVSAEQIRNIICDLDLQTDVTDDCIDGWVKGTVSVRALRKMIRSDILDGFKYDSEIGVNVSYCCDSFFDEKLGEGFADDDAVRIMIGNLCQLTQISEGKKQSFQETGIWTATVLMLNHTARIPENTGSSSARILKRP